MNPVILTTILEKNSWYILDINILTGSLEILNIKDSIERYLYKYTCT